jgi:hypothetical protein
MKRDKTFMMFTEANNRFLLAGALVGDEFRISQDERFLEVRGVEMYGKHPLFNQACWPTHLPHLLAIPVVLASSLCRFTTPT